MLGQCLSKPLIRSRLNIDLPQALDLIRYLPCLSLPELLLFMHGLTSELERDSNVRPLYFYPLKLLTQPMVTHRSHSSCSIPSLSRFMPPPSRIQPKFPFLTRLKASWQDYVRRKTLRWPLQCKWLQDYLAQTVQKQILILEPKLSSYLSLVNSFSASHLMLLSFHVISIGESYLPSSRTYRLTFVLDSPNTGYDASIRTSGVIRFSFRL